jgi:hypothetical protein
VHRVSAFSHPISVGEAQVGLLTDDQPAQARERRVALRKPHADRMRWPAHATEGRPAGVDSFTAEEVSRSSNRRGVHNHRSGVRVLDT